MPCQSCADRRTIIMRAYGCGGIKGAAAVARVVPVVARDLIAKPPKASNGR